MSNTGDVETVSISEDTVAAAADLKVWDENGKEVRFGDLFEGEKTIVVFIRHFFCGVCQAYCGQLAEVKPESLKAAGTKIVVIGCGEWKLIRNYHLNSGFDGPVYADPSVKLYKTLGMTIRNLKYTPEGQKKKSYVGSFWSVTMSSIMKGLKAPSHVGKQGDITQLGGDFIFGPGKTCSFAHLMQHTEDHIEVADLMTAAGVSYP